MRLRHGCSARAGIKASPEYSAWLALKGRCCNKNNKDFAKYGGRGISVCDRWINSFENFSKDMGKRPSSEHSIDRIDVNGNYHPDNCRWATIIQQRQNQRPKTRVTLFNGENTHQASARLGGAKGMVYDRLNSGWEIERAFTEPAKTRKKRSKS
jgi:hypothetical protein